MNLDINILSDSNYKKILCYTLLTILNSKKRNGCTKDYINNYLKIKYYYNNIDNINLTLKKHF